MSTGVLATHGRGVRAGAGDLALDASPPPWRKWKTKSRAARCIRWIETYCRVPSGANAGKPLKLAAFQKTNLERLLGDGVRNGGLQIPRGNAKSTLWAAVGLWATCDEPFMPSVPLIAYNGLQAQRNLLRPLRGMLKLADVELASRVRAYTANNERRVYCAWNEGELLPLPADVERLQGLNPSIALVDEAQTIPPDVLYAIAQGAGKRADSLVLAIGTPAPGRDARSSALFDMRERAAAGAPITWIEYAAAADSAIDDRDEWRRANPALDAGFLYWDVLEKELAGTVPESIFRCYRLGQWLDTMDAQWLPPGAWEACPDVGAPPDDTEIVLGIAGTYMSTVAIVGATLDGAIFLAFHADNATDEQINAMVDAAGERWAVREIVVAPRSRAALVRGWADAGYPLMVWPTARNDVEIASSGDFRRAIVDGQLAHDHAPIIGAHIAATVGTTTPDGQLRLDAPEDGADVDAARAARMAWWRAQEHADAPTPAIY